jgi:hypothetical protein
VFLPSSACFVFYGLQVRAIVARTLESAPPNLREARAPDLVGL